jgi:hypothetical protein
MSKSDSLSPGSPQRIPLSGKTESGDSFIKVPPAASNVMATVVRLVVFEGREPCSGSES